MIGGFCKIWSIVICRKRLASQEAVWGDDGPIEWENYIFITGNYNYERPPYCYEVYLLLVYRTVTLGM